MILVTGGLGFIGAHTARALLDLGETCVVTSHRSARIPPFLRQALGTRLLVEPLEAADRASWEAIGRRHPVTGIVHLAAGGLGATDVLEDARANILALLNALDAAAGWRVRRLALASSIGVYAGVAERPWREEMPLPMLGALPIETYKKVGELLTAYVGGATGLEVAHLRIGGVYGPLGRPESRFVALPRLVHAAVRGEPAVFAPPGRPVYADGAMDLCHVRDCARAIALLQTVPELRHRTYNVGAGRAATNAEVAEAVRRRIPDAEIRFSGETDPEAPGPFSLDIGRLRADTGYAPAFDIDTGVGDYIEWLRAGNER